MSAFSRRALLRLAVLAALLAPVSLLVPASLRAAEHPPIVFVHGNGDTAALWLTTFWRFESNGWPRERLFAIDLRYPSARDNDDKPQEGRSSTAEVRDQLAAFVAEVRERTGAEKVALVGNSRGANTIRNYVKNGGGARFVSHVVLGGGVNHGVIVSDTALVGSEFNGASAFMRQLNEGPSEVVEGVAFLTLRSDRLDKFAQPDGVFLGMPGKPTGIGYDAPALKGATNIVLEGLDHREVSYSAAAFADTYKFITGEPPRTREIEPEARPVLDGRITGITAGAYDNIGVEGATLEIYEVAPATGERQDGPVHRRVTGRDGGWGPFEASPTAYYEFVVSVPGQPVTHIYRSPFPRGSSILHLRPARAVKDPELGSVVTISRPRGYFGIGRDTVLLDGKLPPGINEGVPGTSAATLRLPFEPQLPVPSRFNGENLTLRNWPQGHVTIGEFHF